MKLVKIENYQVVIEPELLLLKPFKTLYDSDKTLDKTKFYQFITMLYFTYDPRSDYMYIIDEDSRLDEVCKTNGLKKSKFGPNEVKCISLYKQLTTTTALELLKSIKIAINAVQNELLSTQDTLNSLESKDKVTALKSLTGTLSAVPDLVKKLTETERIVSKELEEKGRVRGGGNNQSIFEDGI